MSASAPRSNWASTQLCTPACSCSHEHIKSALRVSKVHIGPGLDQAPRCIFNAEGIARYSVELPDEVHTDVHAWLSTSIEQAKRLLDIPISSSRLEQGTVVTVRPSCTPVRPSSYQPDEDGDTAVGNGMLQRYTEGIRPTDRASHSGDEPEDLADRTFQGSGYG